MTTDPSNAVKSMMEHALDKTRPAAVLALAARLTKPKSAWSGRRKLSRDEAMAATKAVTSMLRRFDLQPTKVLVGAGHASQGSATGRFYLTETEMAGGPVSKRLATGISAHVDHVRTIARFAREAGKPVDEDALLTELAEAVGDFLEQFREQPELDPDAELAADINRIAVHLSNPGRGFELARFLAETRRLDLGFDTVSGELSFHGPAAYMHDDGNTPSIPLLTRMVAHAEATLSKGEWEDEEVSTLLFARPKLTPLGRVHCAICEEISLGVISDPDRRGGLRMVFNLDPVTFVGEPGEGVGHEEWETIGYIRFLRFGAYPSGELDTLPDGYYFKAEAPDRYECEEFRAYYGRLIEELEPGDEERLWMRRHLPITPETCRLLLVDNERTAFTLWRSFTDIPEQTSLPREAEDDAGVITRTVRDRFTALLYAEAEPTVAGLLATEAKRRTEALDAFLMKSATGLRRRKLDFRARMRR